MRALAFEVDARCVVNVGRAVDADADRDLVALEDVTPRRIDQDRIGGDAAFDLAAGTFLDRVQPLLKIDEAVFGEEQRLSPVKHQHEAFELVRPDVLLEPLAERHFGLDAQHRRLLVDVGVAKPVAIGAVDVAARRELHQHEGEDRNFCRQEARVAAIR